MAGIIRQYVLLRATPKIRAIYDQGPKAIEDYLKGFGFLPSEHAFLSVGTLPSDDWVLELAEDDFKSPPPSSLVVPIKLNEKTYQRLRAVVAEDVTNQVFLGLGANLPFDTADHWCPGTPENRMFGNRAAAHKLIRADYLAEQGARGQGVNVVLIDRGISRDQIEALGGRYGGGWRYCNLLRPGVTRGGHGLMVARNIFMLASEVTFFDCPLLPEHISDISIFLDLAHAAYERMIIDIGVLRDTGKFPGPWLFVNAWAIYDRKTEYPAGSYSNSLHHPFNKKVRHAVEADIDVVFCAGNCGGFCPSERCGANDRGPRNSIFGANSHPDVITVGAVRSDAIWLGYSSQGPGQPRLDLDKPDFCAPSQFCEIADQAAINDGTSAACALTAGAVAALRSKWDANAISLASLKSILKQTATNPYTGINWKRRLGSGILNLEAAYKALQP